MFITFFECHKFHKIHAANEVCLCECYCHTSLISFLSFYQHKEIFRLTVCVHVTFDELTVLRGSFLFLFCFGGPEKGRLGQVELQGRDEFNLRIRTGCVLAS